MNAIGWFAVGFFMLGLLPLFAILDGHGGIVLAALVQMWGCAAACAWGSRLQNKQDAEWAALMARRDDDQP